MSFKALRDVRFFDSEAEKVIVRLHLNEKEKKMKKKSNKFLALLLAVMMVAVFVPTFSFAVTPNGAAASGSVKITYAISNAGTLAVKNKTVKVTDVNKNGTFDIYDAFSIIHKENNKKFAVNAETGWITKFWSVKDAPVGYKLNDDDAYSLDMKVKSGDYLYGYIYKDSTAWTDMYTSLTDSNGQRTSSYPAYEGVDLVLSVYGYDPNNDYAYGKIDYDYSKAIVTVNDEEQAVEIAADGTFHLNTPMAGKFYISVKSNDDILTPACYYAVAKAATGSVKITYGISNKGKLAVKNKTIKVTDVNKNGKFDIYDAFSKIHKANKKKFAVNKETGWITKFWSVKDAPVGYKLNDDDAWNLDVEIKKGDYLYGFIYKDQTAWSDLYTSLTDSKGKRTSKYTAKKGIDLTLSVYGYDPNNGYAYGKIDYDYSKAIITVNGKAKKVEIAADGSFHLKTPKKGKYYISVKSNDDILTPACYCAVAK